MEESAIETPYCSCCGAPANYLAQQASQAALKEAVREMGAVVQMVANTLIDMDSIHPDGLPAKYLSAYEGMLLVGPKAAALINRHEVKEIMEEK